MSTSGASSPTAVADDHSNEFDHVNRGLDPASMARALANAPVVSSAALRAVPAVVGDLASRAFLGHELGIASGADDDASRVFLNTGVPWTGIVLGEQGSGVGNSSACLLESCLLSDARVGKFDGPMATLVCRFDELNAGLPSRTVALTHASDQKVTVLVSPRRLKHMRKIYAGLDRVSVLPLSLRSSDVSPAILLRVFENESPRLRRFMRTKLLKSADAVNYSTLFKEALLELPESERDAFQTCIEFLEDIVDDASTSINLHFESGRLVILDVTDPLLSPLAAGNLFAVATHAFANWNHAREKVALLDNAQVYMFEQSALAETLLQLARHTQALNMRILIAADDPRAVPSVLLGNAAFVLCHKLTAPSACEPLAGLLDDPPREPQWRRQLVELFPGEAVLISSKALVLDELGAPVLLGGGQMTMCIRERLTPSLAPSRSASASASASTSNSTSPMSVPRSSLPNAPPPPEEPPDVLAPQPMRTRMHSTYVEDPETPTAPHAHAPLPPQHSTLPVFPPSVSAASTSHPSWATTSMFPSSATTSTLPSSLTTSMFPSSATTSTLPSSLSASALSAAATTSSLHSSATTSNLPISATTSNLPISATTSNLPISATTSTLPISATTSTLPASATTSTLPASATTSTLPSSATTSTLPPFVNTSSLPPHAPSVSTSSRRHAPPSSSSSSSHHSRRQHSSSSHQQLFWQPAPSVHQQSRLRPKVTVEEVEEPETRAAPPLDNGSSHILEQVSRRGEPRAEVHAPLSDRTGARVAEHPGAGHRAPQPPPPPSSRVPASSVSRSPPTAAPPLRTGSAASFRTSMTVTSPKRFGDLLSALEAFAERGQSRPLRTEVAAEVGDGFVGTGFVTFRGYALAAEKAGLIRRGTSSAGEWLELA